ncbi:protein kinase family protein [Bifidobacterium sp. 82T24]|uniref:serine/threonine protein kinase n=1 Tax=Bifidobacterium pluvialisilvae TaxID=2834436 RepID=UPI001C5675CE|nr:protein kinase family protein [Bifidobacterium pluvialisilvae]MBW3088158.1 protein kinase family protein [Bifidobacterium pluvialisilvae]
MPFELPALLTHAGFFVGSGRHVGRYVIGSRIGGGRYGVCFTATDATGNRVVLKRFRHRIWKRNAGRNHFEAVILSGLHHRAIPELLGVINDKSGYYFVLEYKAGKSLRQRLFDDGHAFPKADIRRIGTQLLDILVYLHGRGVIHGDVSVANVLDDGAHVSLVDFGLARYAQGDARARDAGQYDLDYACFANVMLYLMYSCPEFEYCGGEAPWYDDLPLTDDQRHCMRRMMGLDPTYEDTSSAAADFQSAFAPWRVSDETR